MKQTRTQVINWLEKRFQFVSTTEEFNGSEGGIWLSGENNEEYCGQVIFEYYDMSDNRRFGVLAKWEDMLNKKGWYSEWNDAGTVMLREI